MTPASDLDRAVEAALFASEGPLSTDEIARRLEVNDVSEALARVAARHAGHGIELVERGGRWHFPDGSRPCAPVARNP